MLQNYIPSVQYVILILIVVVWTLVYFVARSKKWNKRNIKIYPLIFMMDSLRMKKFIENQAKKHRRFWQYFSKMASIVMVLSIVFSLAYFTLNLIYLLQKKLIFTPSAIPIGAQLVPVIPFITISPEFILIIIFASAIAIFPHELAHGAVSINEGIDIDHAGFFVFFGVIFGGYVKLPEEVEKILEDVSSGETLENDEKNENLLKKLTRVLAAGITANTILAIVFFLMFINASVIISPFYSERGIRVLNVIEDSPAEHYGILPGDVIYRLNSTEVYTIDDFISFISSAHPGDLVVIETERGKLQIYLGSHPINASKAYLGVEIIRNYTPKFPFLPENGPYYFNNFIYILYTIQVLVIFLNALPAFAMDGAKYLLLQLIICGIDKEKAFKIYLAVSILSLIILLGNILVSLASL